MNKNIKSTKNKPMKNQNSNVLFKLIVIVMITIMLGCVNNAVRTEQAKEIVIHSRCSSDEIVNDLEYSVNQIKDKLASKHIIVKNDTLSNDCGYMFVYGEKKKQISTVLTDLELSEEVDKFYK